MVRLRLIHLDPDFSTPNAKLQTQKLPNHWILPRDFEERYLIEALLSHGTITIPEIEDTILCINRYRQDFRLTLLEGLFKWNRSGTIDKDIRRMFQFCFHISSLSRSVAELQCRHRSTDFKVKGYRSQDPSCFHPAMSCNSH